MAMKAKHAFGALERVDQSIQSGVIDAYDILFVKDAEGKPYVGWVDKNGEKVIVDDSAEFAELETQIATKANAEEVEAKFATKADAAEVEAELATKANANDVAALESEVATKANAEDVEAQIGQAVTDTKAYTDGKIEAAINEHMIKKYEITSVPEGTLVDYRDKEIRVMCPADTQWIKQSVGATGNANMYYMGFKAYAPEGAVGFKEGDRGVIIDEYFDFTGDFAGTDEYGRNYSICWLALASYDATSDKWTYFGKNSSKEKYIGWDYIVEWYNADGVVMASDCVRINLSNEDCHFLIEPYYVGKITKEIDTKIEEKIKEVEVSYEVIEF